MNLRQLVGRCAELGGSFDQFLIEHGTMFTGHRLPKKYWRGPAGQCFQNAALLALDDADLTYVEGYGAIESLGSIPMHHAWCVTKRGKVIDPTWKSERCEYFGVPVPEPLLRAELLRTKHYGLLFVKGRFNDRFARRWRSQSERGGTGQPAERPVP